MAQLSMLVIPLAVSVSLLLPSTTAYKCYDCSSTNMACQDPFVPSDQVRTSDGDVCYKGTTKSNNIDVVVRNSLYDFTYIGCRDEYVSGYDVTVCYCTSDLCNGATPLRSTLGVASVASVASVAVAMMLAAWLIG